MTNSNNILESEAGFLDLFVKILIEQGVLDAAQLKYAERVCSKLETAKPLLVVLCDLGYATHEGLIQVFREHEFPIRLGKFLLEFGYITHTDLELTVKSQQQEGVRKRLGEILVERNLLSETKLLEVLAHMKGLSAIDLTAVNIDQSLITKHCLNPPINTTLFRLPDRMAGYWWHSATLWTVKPCP